MLVHDPSWLAQQMRHVTLPCQRRELIKLSPFVHFLADLDLLFREIVMQGQLFKVSINNRITIGSDANDVQLLCSCDAEVKRLSDFVSYRQRPFLVVGELRSTLFEESFCLRRIRASFTGNLRFRLINICINWYLLESLNDRLASERGHDFIAPSYSEWNFQVILLFGFQQATLRNIHRVHCKHLRRSTCDSPVEIGAFNS